MKRHTRHLSICIFILVLVASLFVPSETVQAASSAKEHKVVRVGYFADDVFHAGQSDDAIKSGYGYEYYQKISNYTAWEYEYYYGDWNEIYQAFLKGEIDIIDDISITNDRLTVMDFSALPMGEENYYIFVPEDTDITISNIHSLDGKRIGADRNSLNFTYLVEFVRENDLDIWIEPCEGYQDRLNKMKYGLIDGMVTIDSFAEPGFKSIFRLGSQNFYFAVNKA
ncbi:MAG: transporter substrate-binding domain-containing protein, partial [Parasporobacterium sp.]|nr:transporter substrate-binding domain-containing protein [Parasporobacterium sp.]